LRLRKEEVDRAGSLLFLMVEYEADHAELPVIVAPGDWRFSGCEVTSSFF